MSHTLHGTGIYADQLTPQTTIPGRFSAVRSPMERLGVLLFLGSDASADARLGSLQRPELTCKRSLEVNDLMKD